MKFSSKKGALFSIVVICTIALVFGLAVYGLFKGALYGLSLWVTLASMTVALLPLWIFLDTHYVLTNTELQYTSGPFRGKIKLDHINEIKVGETMWTGFRPATASNGLTIKYDNSRQLYISPKTNKEFLQKLLELKQGINVTSVV